MALNFKTLQSSNIASAAHDPENDELHIKFKSGAAYIYADVNEDEADDFFNAPSHGKHHNENLAGVKKYRRA